VSDLPQPAVEHLYPFLVLAVAVVAILAAILGAVVKGIRDLKALMRSEIRASYSEDEEGKPGIAAVMTRRIVEQAFSSNLEHITKALRDVELVQQDLAEDLKEHERREFDRGDQRDRELKADVSRTIEAALRYPKELASQYQIVRATVDEHGKRLDDIGHRVRVLEAK
jgi:hypothetical protein